MLWKIWWEPPASSQISVSGSSSPRAYWRPPTAEPWSRRQIHCSLMGRECSLEHSWKEMQVHSGKGWAIIWPFFSITSARKQGNLSGGEETQIGSETQVWSLCSLSCLTSYWIRDIYDLDFKGEGRHSTPVQAPRALRDLAGTENKEQDARQVEFSVLATNRHISRW